VDDAARHAVERGRETASPGCDSPSPRGSSEARRRDLPLAELRQERAELDRL